MWALVDETLREVARKGEKLDIEKKKKNTWGQGESNTQQEAGKHTFPAY